MHLVTSCLRQIYLNPCPPTYTQINEATCMSIYTKKHGCIVSSQRSKNICIQEEGQNVKIINLVTVERLKAVSVFMA